MIAGSTMRRRWGTFAQLIVAFVAMTAIWTAFGFLVIAAENTGFGRVEQRFSSWLANDRDDILVELSGWASRPADTLVKVVVVAVLGVAMRLVFKRWNEWLYLVTALLLELSVYGAVSRIVGRERPDVEQLSSTSAQSWPSGHVAAAVTLYLGLWLIVRRTSSCPKIIWQTLGVTIIVIASVGVSRLYLGAHFVSDVFSGALLGVASLWITTLAFARMGQTSAPDA